MNIRYSAAPLGAEITGLNLAEPLADDTFRAAEDVLHDRGVVVFRDQQLTEEQHIAFSRRFGELEIHVAKQYLKPGLSRDPGHFQCDCECPEHRCA